MEFKERSIKVSIDTSKCPACTTKACIEACKTFDRGILQLKDGVPSVAHLSNDEVVRRGTECLACEYACWKRGLHAISIDIPIKGLADYLQGKPLTGLVR
jgi:hypothetical protein